MKRDPEKGNNEIVVQGMGVSPGVAIGTVFLMMRDEEPIVSRRLEPGMVADEIARFDAAVTATRRRIKAIQGDLWKRIGSHDARILDVHIMVLDDETFMEEIRAEIRERHHNAEYALWGVSERYSDILSRTEDDYLRERVGDIKDIVRRLLRELIGRHGASIETVPRDSIIVADNLAPADTALLRRELVGGLATDFGSPVSHTAILARALEIPAVVALHELTSRVSPGDRLLIDGYDGLVVIRPSAARIKKFGDLMDRRHRQRVEIEARARGLESVTADDVSVALYANIDGTDDLEDVEKYDAEGIGLFRSENVFFRGGRYASEKDQIQVYRGLAQRMNPRPVIVRTFDLGGDKAFAGLAVFREDNPFLGCRGIRFCLSESVIFKRQLRAIAMAAEAGDLKLMYPMLSDVGELLRANEMLRAVCRRAGVAVPAVGAMIETPSAALCAEAIAPHVAFMSIGSNDLIQYVMAADRGNDRVSYLFQPTHPAILRLIKKTVDSAAEHGIPVGICGEMAGDPVLTPLLVGLGVSELSMFAAAIPLVKTVLRQVRGEEARRLASESLESRSARDVLESCREWLKKRVPEVYEWNG